MDVKATLKGHKGRVVYMSVGPDSKRIVTGAGDETLRFWEVFNQDKKVKENMKKENRNNNFCLNDKNMSSNRISFRDLDIR